MKIGTPIVTELADSVATPAKVLLAALRAFTALAKIAAVADPRVVLAAVLNAGATVAV
jgi:hypothetical protein